MYLSILKLFKPLLDPHLETGTTGEVGAAAAAVMPDTTLAGPGAGTAAISYETILAHVVLLKLEILKFKHQSYEAMLKEMNGYLSKSNGRTERLEPADREGVLVRLKGYRESVSHGWKLPADAPRFIRVALGDHPPSKLATRLRKALFKEVAKMISFYQSFYSDFEARMTDKIKLSMAPQWTIGSENEGKFQEAVDAAVTTSSLRDRRPNTAVLHRLSIDWNRSLARLFGAAPLDATPTGEEAWAALKASPVGRDLCLEMQLLAAEFLPQNGGHNAWFSCATTLHAELVTPNLRIMKEDRSAPLELGLKRINGSSIIMYCRDAWVANTAFPGVQEAMGLDPEHLIQTGVYEGAKTIFPVMQLTTYVRFDILGGRRVSGTFTVEATPFTPNLETALTKIKQKYNAKQARRIAFLEDLTPEPPRGEFGRSGRMVSEYLPAHRHDSSKRRVSSKGGFFVDSSRTLLTGDQKDVSNSNGGCLPCCVVM